MHKTCPNCLTSFEITDTDHKFYQKMEVPAPTLCPECRQQRRLVWRNERRLYNRKCDLCKKEIVSVFAADIPYRVYCKECWWSDKWDAHTTGRPFDFSRSFFEQFDELMRATPLLFSYNLDSTNSDYNNWSSYLKNCYLMASSNYSEDCYYGRLVNNSRNCLDCISVYNSELCYESVECYNCYNVAFSKNLQNCRDSYFLENCIGCADCFGCVNLRQKQYCFLNEQLSREAYFAKLKEFDMGNSVLVDKAQDFFNKHRLKFPMRYFIGENNEDISGNDLQNCNNAHTCFDCKDIQDSKFCYQLQEAKDCYDVMTWGRTGELLYEVQATGDKAYQNRFTSICRGSKYLSYCVMCMFSENLFGCVGMQKGQYCILNRQYTREEYEKLVRQISEHMTRTSEWGEFFPIRLSPFAYNESIAQDYFPTNKPDITARNGRWKDEDLTNRYQGPKVEIPDSIDDVKPEITTQILTCEQCARNYKIVSQELRFYQDRHLPAPKRCPECRFKNRMQRINPRKLWERTCMKCTAPIKTSYAPERPEIVYCEQCYREAVY